MWTILSTDTFSKWIASSAVDESAAEDIRAALIVLREFGPSLGRPRVDSLKGSNLNNMKELRVQSKGRPFRILFAFDPLRQAILLVGGDKTGDKRFYDKLIPIAEKIIPTASKGLTKMKRKATTKNDVFALLETRCLPNPSSDPT